MHIDAVLGMLAQEFLTRTSAEWMALLEAADLPVTPVHTLETILDDPHLVATGFFEAEDHPTEGRITRMAVPVTFSATPTGERSPSPRLGGDSAAILAEAGYAEAEIAVLRQRRGARRLSRAQGLLQPRWATAEISTRNSGFTRPHWMHQRAGSLVGKNSR